MVMNRMRKNLLAWYRKNRRDLPWRNTGDPYRIWVSEIMLQQTQVETVIPYYLRFLERFPDVRRLAAASTGEVLKAWENLGYYGRARNLLAAARMVMDRFGGTMPRTFDDWLGLPGIGRYTAAAVASMAFDERAASVDGNVKRVLARLFAMRKALGTPDAEKTLQCLADELLPRNKPGEWNQALMDLGAMVCLPRNPRCDVCPVRKHCQGLELGIQESLPVRKKPRPLPHRHSAAARLRNRRGRVLVVRRGEGGLLGGLWKLPGGTMKPGETLEAGLRRTVLEELGIRILVGKPIASVKHAYTHFRVTLHAFECTLVSGRPRALGCSEFLWIAPGRFGELAFSKVDREILRLSVGGANG